MKIAWLNEHLLYWNGGIRYVYEVTRRLRKDHIVNIFHLGISKENYERFSNSGVIPVWIAPANVKSVKYWLFYPYYLLYYASEFKGWFYDCDIAISSSPTTHILCWLAGVKPILVVFELNPWLYSKEYQKGLTPLQRMIVKLWSPVAKFMEKKAYQNAVKIIAYSKFVQSEIKRVYGVDSEVVYTGIDTEFFKRVEV